MRHRWHQNRDAYAHDVRYQMIFSLISHSHSEHPKSSVPRNSTFRSDHFSESFTSSPVRSTSWNAFFSPTSSSAFPSRARSCTVTATSLHAHR